jgi:lysophospholipid acyltransferase (LPLAT)-like uncharacterized protein
VSRENCPKETAAANGAVDQHVTESRADEPGNSTALPAAGLRTFSFRKRLQIAIAGWIGWIAVTLIGASLRWKITGWENWQAATDLGKGLIYTFWHREIIPATWFWRKRGIVVMTSQNFDGEIIARVIQRHGYGAARGSSSRGGTRALVEMVRCLRRGRDTAFTIDGPRGPRFVAKPGAVMLSRTTGAAILCFHISLAHAHVFQNSWDHHQIPLPFSRAAVFIAPPIVVSHDADDAEMNRQQSQVQATLDDLRRQGEDWVQQTRRRR